MKNFTLFLLAISLLLLSAGCGKDLCEDYCTGYCDKLKECYPAEYQSDCYSTCQSEKGETSGWILGNDIMTIESFCDTRADFFTDSDCTQFNVDRQDLGRPIDITYSGAD